MNTKIKQNQKDQQQKTRQKQGPKKRGRHPDDQRRHEHELPELRLTR
jgi:hypothetical protein